VESLLRRLVRDDRGQDLVEYALLTAFFGLCALAAWTGILDAVGLNYSGATTDVQPLWDTPPPLPSGS
jgi:Flp pilus assembly pilin Flp